MKMSGLVSVIIPTYNRAHCIKRSIDSVLSQTYSNVEVIIVDDCSTDDTKTIVSSYTDQRIRYVKLDKNSGACAARNKGIDIALGEFVAFQDSDDVWHQDKLEKQLNIFKNNIVDVVVCKLLVDEEILKPQKLPEGRLDLRSGLFEIGTQTIVARKEVFDEFKFDIMMPRFQEFEWLLRVIKKHTIYCIDTGLVDYHFGKDSIGTNNHTLYEATLRILSLYKNFHKIYPVSAQQLSNYLLRVANLMRKEKRPSKKDFIKLAWECCPSLETCMRWFLVRLGLLGIVSKLKNR